MATPVLVHFVRHAITYVSSKKDTCNASCFPDSTLDETQIPRPYMFTSPVLQQFRCLRVSDVVSCVVSGSSSVLRF